jgi:hypothetical protein
VFVGRDELREVMETEEKIARKNEPEKDIPDAGR